MGLQPHWDGHVRLNWWLFNSINLIFPIIATLISVLTFDILRGPTWISLPIQSTNHKTHKQHGYRCLSSVLPPIHVYWCCISLILMEDNKPVWIWIWIWIQWSPDVTSLKGPRNFGCNTILKKKSCYCTHEMDSPVLWWSTHATHSGRLDMEQLKNEEIEWRVTDKSWSWKEALRKEWGNGNSCNRRGLVGLWDKGG